MESGPKSKKVFWNLDQKPKCVCGIWTKSQGDFLEFGPKDKESFLEFGPKAMLLIITLIAIGQYKCREINDTCHFIGSYYPPRECDDGLKCKCLCRNVCSGFEYECYDPNKTPASTPINTPINTPWNTPINTPWFTPINTPAETPNQTYIPKMTPIEEIIFIQERDPSNLKFYLIYAAVAVAFVVIVIIIVICCCIKRKEVSSTSSSQTIAEEEIVQYQPQWGATITFDCADMEPDDPFLSDFDSQSDTAEFTVSDEYFQAMEEK